MAEPRYRQTGIARIEEKHRQALQLWVNCALCPRFCQVDRSMGETGKCGASNRLTLASYGPHFGEESVLTGIGGSGTIFFMHCNLECAFCQNWTISRGAEKGEDASPSQLARIMIFLQDGGCQNINLVSPTPYLPLILAALAEATDKGLSIPLVYNCGGYENTLALKLLDGIVDIYLPDAKYAHARVGKRYSGVSKYPSYLKDALQEMQRQVGDLEIEERGAATRGLLVRHLVLPEGLAGTEGLVKMIAHQVSSRCAINIMEQYYPAYRAREYSELNRRVSRKEYLKAVEAARKEGLRIVR